MSGSHRLWQHYRHDHAHILSIEVVVARSLNSAIDTDLAVLID
jgi:hypothetical protein